MKVKKYLYNLSLLSLSLAIFPSYGAGQFIEPKMIDYTNYPIFQLNTQKPNIMIILDNSGSMNYNAYGTSKKNGENVPESYDDPTDCGIRETAVTTSAGDSEQQAAGGVPYYNNNDLDLGSFEYEIFDPAITGLHFKTVDVPWNRDIFKAYIKFTPHENSSDNCSLTLYGHATGNAPEFTTTSNELKNIRDNEKTAATVSWDNIPRWIANTANDDTTVDITAIVQELVKRQDWKAGNSMAFVIDGKGKRNAHAYDSDPAKAPQLYIEFAARDDDCNLYYGNFDSGTYEDGVYKPSLYGYGSNIFQRCEDTAITCTANNTWDGNWLNWITTRRIDVLRKVLAGGKLGGTQGLGALQVLGANQAPAEWYFSKLYNTSSNPAEVTPYKGNYRYVTQPNGTLKIFNNPSDAAPQLVGTYTLKVQKYPDLEPEEFNEDRDQLEGVFQRVRGGARWGNMWFNLDPNKGTADGGKLGSRIQGGNLADLISDVVKEPCDGYTPLAETLTTAMYYFKQEQNPIPNGTKLVLNDENDPYVDDSKGVVECAKSFILLLTDGTSTDDLDVPDYLKNTDGDDSENSGVAVCTEADLKDFPSGDCFREFDEYPDHLGSDYLDDVAYYARTTDLRPDNDPIKGLDGDQNLYLYTIYAFGDDPTAQALLKDAAINGGFQDSDGDKKPDIVGDPRGGEWGDLGHNKEWDKNGDGNPDNYYEAKDGRKLKDEILRAINDILNRAASGTALSVLATRGEGEGVITQAFFKPAFPTVFGEIKWLGFMQMLWVDQFGLLREDTDGDQSLNIYEDKIVDFFLNKETGESSVRRYTPDINAPYLVDNATYETALLEDINPVWEAGEILSQRDSDTRKIFTYLNDNSTLDFITTNAGALAPYLGVEDNTVWGIGAGLGATEDNRVNNIIRFVRGVNDPTDPYDPDGTSAYEGSPSLRQRTVTEEGAVWKLGDIVNSTPVTISEPVENYGRIYQDFSFNPYLQKYLNRETVVYVGANDGMLHAFTAGIYDSDTQSFETPSTQYLSDMGTSIVGNIGLGDELWAYIPRSLLPHLKWLPQNGYTHVSYVDLKVKVTDAPIFTPDDTHPNGWGTILLGGLNLGGKDIPTQNAGAFTPSVFALDVTNPRDPQVLWEKSFADLGLSTNTPGVIRVGGEWKVVITSGPTDFSYDELTGELTISSDQNAHAYIVDMATGDVERDYIVPGNAFTDSYLNTPVAFDEGLDYNVDAIYMGATYNSNKSGAIFKITVPKNVSGDLANEDDGKYNPDPYGWSDIKLLALAPAPITGPLALSTDRFKNTWIYGGTGRYMDQPDKTNEAQNYLFGIKDPLKYGLNTDYENEANLDPISIYPNANDLFDADPYTVSAGGAITNGGAITSWRQLLQAARSFKGWRRSLCPGSIIAGAWDQSCSNSGPSERSLSKPALLSGIVFFPTFSPSSDVCGFGGEGRLFALYYETGTAFFKRVFGDPSQDPVHDVWYLGSGLSSSFGVHIGREKGATIFGQMSTGVIKRIEAEGAYELKNQPIYWKNYLED